jgi:hypothetical protein
MQEKLEKHSATYIYFSYFFNTYLTHFLFELELFVTE